MLSFTENIKAIHNFDLSTDSIYIFDSSPEDEWRDQLNNAAMLCDSYGLVWGKNLFFIRRRNWGGNNGANLDYFRCLLDGRIQLPKYTTFVQMHYFDLNYFVKEDTLPDDAIFDLNEMDYYFQQNSGLGCGFHTRYGVRVITSNPIKDRRQEFFGDGEELLPGAIRRGFCVDGSNFTVRPELHLNWFRNHPSFLTRGDGSLGFSHMWETRFGQILYRAKIKWRDFYRGIEYYNIEQLDEIERNKQTKISKLWYDNRVWFLFYGRDQWRYPPTPIRSVVRYIRPFLSSWLKHSRDTRLTFLNPDTRL